MKFFRNIFNLSLISAAYHIIGLIKDFYLSQYLIGKEFRDQFIQGWSLLSTFRSLLSEATLSKIFVPILSKIKVKFRALVANFCLVAVVLSVGLFFLSRKAWFLKVFAPKALYVGPAEASFVSIYKGLFLTFPILTLAAIFGVLALCFKSLWQMPAGPLVFNSVALASIYCCLKLDLKLEFVCYGLIVASIAKAIFRGLALYYSAENSDCQNYSSHDDKGGALQAFYRAFGSNAVLLAFVGVLRWGYRISLVWFGSFLPKGQLSVLFFCHRIVDAVFPVLCAGIDNWILVVFSGPKNSETSFFSTLKVAIFMIFSIFLLMLASTKLLATRFFASAFDLVFAYKVYFLIVSGAFVGSCLRVLRAFFYSKLAYRAILASNFIEVFFDLAISYFATFFIAPSGVYLAFSSLLALSMALVVSVLFLLQMEKV